MTWEKFEQIYNDYAQERINTAPTVTDEDWDAFIGSLEQNGYNTVEKSRDHVIATKSMFDARLYVLAIRQEKLIAKYTFERFDSSDILNFGLRRFTVVAEKTSRGGWWFNEITETTIEK